METKEIVFAALLVGALAGLAGFYAWLQVRMLRRLGGSHGLSHDESRWRRGQAWRRLAGSVLMLAMAGTFAWAALVMGPEASQLAAQGRPRTPRRKPTSSCFSTRPSGSRSFSCCWPSSSSRPWTSGPRAASACGSSGKSSTPAGAAGTRGRPDAPGAQRPRVSGRLPPPPPPPPPRGFKAPLAFAARAPAESGGSPARPARAGGRGAARSAFSPIGAVQVVQAKHHPVAQSVSRRPAPLRDRMRRGHADDRVIMHVRRVRPRRQQLQGRRIGPSRSHACRDVFELAQAARLTWVLRRGVLHRADQSPPPQPHQIVGQPARRRRAAAVSRGAACPGRSPARTHGSLWKKKIRSAPPAFRAAYRQVAERPIAHQPPEVARRCPPSEASRRSPPMLWPTSTMRPRAASL